MSCPTPAATGVPVLQVIAIGTALLLLGAVLLLLARPGRARVAVPIVLALVCGVLLVGPVHPSEARAAMAACPLGAGPTSVSQSPAPRATLTVAQTSTLAGLAPGVAPAHITGVVTNRGSASTYVDTVTVRIIAVRAPHSGRCSAADYVLLDTVMPFAQTLAPGGSGNFAGARIGFRDRAINQDSCQRAVVTLEYVTS
jgi:hypothetical protein